MEKQNSIKGYFFRGLRRFLWRTAPLWKNDRLFLILKFYSRLHYFPNLRKPRTFCEKMQWLKLNYKQKEYTSLVDKVTVKDYIASLDGGSLKKYLIPTITIYETAEDIDFDALPSQFVMKVSHDSGGLIICRDKKLLNIDSTREKMRLALQRTYVQYNREYPYAEVPRRIIVEKYMKNGKDQELKDYKFFCFNGKPEYCQVIADRHTRETIDFYDMNWNHQPFCGLNPKAVNADHFEDKPLKFEEMKQIVSKLCKGYPFIRVDLYNVNDEIYFGELTFFPASGMGVFTPREWDVKLGDMITLPQPNNK